MKKKIGWLLTLLLMLIPFNVSAEVIKSDIYSVEDKNISFNLDEFQFKDTFSTIKDESFQIKADITNLRDYTVKGNMNIRLYDINKEQIGLMVNSEEDIFLSDEYICTFKVEEYDLYSGYQISQIAYYQFESEFEKYTIPENDTEKETGIEITDFLNKDYIITGYHVNIKVNIDNTFDITETITVYFNVDKHGIFRKLPLSNNVVREDGTGYKNRAFVSNINVNNQYTTYNEDGHKIIRIGNPDFTVTGSQKYEISYKYKIRGQASKDFDELYYNIIGLEWDTYIENVTFSIEMPDSFDEKLLGFTHGVKGSNDTSNIEYTVDGNTITGEFNGTLKPYEGLTVRLELPKGYFVIPPIEMTLLDLLVIAFSVFFVGLAYYLWTKHGKDDLVVDAVEFYPPNDLNSLEIGYIHNNGASNSCIMSLLIYLAHKGYLKIEEKEDHIKFFDFGKNNFTITKLKEYDGSDENEKIFFEGLFKDKNEVTNSDLYDRFYKTVSKVSSNVNTEEHKQQYYEKSSMSSKGKIMIMMIILLILTNVNVVYSAMDFTYIAYIIYIIIAFVVIANSIATGGKITLGGVIFSIIIGTTMLVFPIIETLKIVDLTTVTLAVYLIGMIASSCLVLMYAIAEKRNVHGTLMYGKVKGFRNFLETAEKPQLEALVEKNPQYFYNILPYTYALGVSTKWVEKFEGIAMESPSWYSSYSGSTFSIVSFNSFVSSTMSSASHSPSSDGGGGSSGGGSSGGGSGGGGGGSW